MSDKPITLKDVEAQECLLIKEVLNSFMADIKKNSTGMVNKVELAYIIGCFVGMRTMAHFEGSEKLVNQILDDIDKAVTRHKEDSKVSVDNLFH